MATKNKSMKHFSITIYIAFFVFFFIINEISGQNIHKASSAGNQERVKELLESDSTLLESRDNGGNTPLITACFNPTSSIPQEDIAKYLIEKGADVNARNNYGFTPLCQACRGTKENVNLIQLLIDKGADVNAQLSRGMNALHFAVLSNDLDAAKFLISRGANPNAFDKVLYGTVLQMSIFWGHDEEIAKLLVNSGATLNRKFGYNNTELHLAVLKGYTDLAQLLIKKGANIHAENKYGHTALYYAAKHGYQKVAELLIDHGANRSDIIETNFGAASQLTSKLKEGEAWIWFLGGPGDGGYAVKTKNNLLIFDNTNVSESKESGLANGHLNPKELTGLNITLFLTKTAWFKNPEMFELDKRISDINWILDAHPDIHDIENIDIPKYHLAIHHQNFSLDGINFYTIPVSGKGYGGAKGVGYLTEADGVKVFNAGFHVSTNKNSQLNHYYKEIDSLKNFSPIDIAILPIKSHLHLDYEPYLYLIDQLKPKVVYLTGGDGMFEESEKCIEALKNANVPVFYPDGGVAIGQRFHYLRE